MVGDKIARPTLIGKKRTMTQVRFVRINVARNLQALCRRLDAAGTARASPGREHALVALGVPTVADQLLTAHRAVVAPL